MAKKIIRWTNEFDFANPYYTWFDSREEADKAAKEADKPRAGVWRAEIVNGEVVKHRFIEEM